MGTKLTGRSELEVLLRQQDGQRLVDSVVSMCETPAVASGENFLSEIGRLRLEVVLRNGRRAFRSLIVKRNSMDRNKPMEYAISLKTNRKELMMYKETLPSMEEVFEEYDDYDDKNWCDFYAFDKRGIFLLQDLKPLGYGTADRRRGLGRTEAVLALRALARLHAASRVLLDRARVLPSAYPPLALVSVPNVARSFAVRAIKNLAGVIKAEWGPEWLEVGQRLDADEDELTERVLALGRQDHSLPQTLQHGDAWTNNILIKKDHRDRPSQIKLIDFQLSLCTHHIAWDLTYFLYTSVERSLRRREEAGLVAAYHSALQHYLRLYRRPEKDIPTLEDVRRDAKEIRFWAMVTTVFHFGFMSSVEEVGLDYMEVLRTGGERGHNLAVYRRPGYREDVGPDLKAFLKEGIF